MTLEKLTEQEIEVLMSYFEKIGKNVEDIKDVKKISEGLYRGESSVESEFLDKERVEVNFSDNACSIDRISTFTYEEEGKDENMEKKIRVSLTSDKFTKESDNILWTTSTISSIAGDNDNLKSGFMTDDINSNDYMTFVSDHYVDKELMDTSHKVLEEDTTKIAPSTSSTLFTDISSCDFKTISISNSNITEETTSKTI